MDVVMSFCGLCLLLAIGKLLRVRVRLLQRLFLPASVIGGLIGLILLNTAGHWLAPGWTAGWSRLPGILINVVFAALFLGVTIPPLKTIWRQAGPQLAYGQIVAWGQYVVGLGLVLLFLAPLFGVPPLFGVIVPVGFEGGHGTAGGLGPTFEQLGWEAGKDFGLASATAGIVSAIVVGMLLVNWTARRGIVKHLRSPASMSELEQAGLYPVDRRPPAGRMTVKPESVDAPAAFGYKQLLHEPFMGGGLWTSSAVLLVTITGAWPVFLISVAAVAAWLIVWALVFRGSCLKKP